MDIQDKIDKVYLDLKGVVPKISILGNKKYETDFGQCIRRKPGIVVHVTSESDISNTMRIANQYKLPVAVRGAGHSCNGQTVTSGILLVNYSLEPSGEMKLLDDNQFVEVPTRNTWYNLVNFLHKNGLSCPVLTDHLLTSIGGTLSVGGGYNNMSLHYGGQLDQVVKVKMVLANGDVLWCSPSENPELFKFSLGGFSTLGVIESVVMRVCKNERFTTYHTKYVPYEKDKDFDDIFQQMIDITSMENAPSWVHMGISKYYPFLQSKVQNIFTRGLSHLANMLYYNRVKNSKKHVYIEYGYTYDSPLYHYLLHEKIKESGKKPAYFFYGTVPSVPNDGEIPRSEVENLIKPDTKLPEYLYQKLLPDEDLQFRAEQDKVLNNHKIIDIWLKTVLRSHKKLWIDFGLTLDKYKEFLEYAKPLFKDDYLSAIYIAKVKRPEYSPELPFHLVSTKEAKFSLGLYYAIPKCDKEAASKIRWILNRLTEKCVELGGRPYLYGSVDLSESIKKKIWGKDYDDLVALKHKYDPNNIITSSPITKSSK